MLSDVSHPSQNMIRVKYCMLFSLLKIRMNELLNYIYYYIAYYIDIAN